MLSLAISAVLLFATAMGWAQAPIIRDTSLGLAAKSYSGTTMTIPQADGKTVGNNLFHSFSKFNIPALTTADFTGSGVQNILTRVTGTEISDIQGTLKSSIPGANFFLMNPNGVVFGPGATIDLRGNFAVTTADYIKLADGTRFNAAPVPPETFSSAAPEAFGFLGFATPGTITVNGSKLGLNSGTSLLLAGGDTTIQASGTGNYDGARLETPSGSVKIASVKSSGLLDLLAWDTSEFAALGSVVIRGGDSGNNTQTRITTSGFQAGSIFIKGENVTVSQSASIRAELLNIGIGGGITIEARNTLSLSDNGRIVTQTGDFASGTAAPISLTAKSVSLTSNGRILGDSFSDTAAGSDISIRAGDLTMDGRLDNPLFSPTSLGARTLGAGPGGRIFLGVTTLSLLNSAYISSSAFGSGSAGRITIAGAKLGLANNAVISSDTSGTGSGGSVTIDGGEISLDNSFVSTGSFSASSFRRGGDAGNIQIRGNSLSLNNFSSVSTATYGQGNAGPASLSVNSISLGGASEISSSTRGSGRGGDITIATSSLVTIDRLSTISSLTAGSGNGGSIAINAISSGLNVSGPGQIASGSSGAGSSGNVTLNGGSGLAQVGSGTVVSSGASASGNAGTISVAGNGVAIGQAQFISKSTLPSTGGKAGDVVIDGGTGPVQLLAGATLITDTYGPAAAGTITVRGGSVLARAAQMQSQARFGAAGAAGNIVIDSGSGSVELVDSTRLTTANYGSGLGGTITVTGGGILTRNADINADGLVGRAGEILLLAGRDGLQVTEGSTLSSQTYGNAFGGRIYLRGFTVELAGVGSTTRVTTDTAPGSIQKGGSISIVGFNGVTVGAGSRIESNVGGTGDGGDMTISGARITAQAAYIESQGKFGSKGNGGRITFDAGQGLLEIKDSTQLNTTMKGAGLGGEIRLKGGAITLSGISINSDGVFDSSGNIFILPANGSLDVIDSTISSTTYGIVAKGSKPESSKPESSKVGGSINLLGDAMVMVTSTARITANSKGAGTGGGIFVTGDAFQLSGHSGISAKNEGTGNGGQIMITAQRGNIDLMEQSTITVSSDNADAGNIILATPQMLRLRDRSSIEAAAKLKGGNVEATARFVILDQSRIVADADVGDGGKVKITSMANMPADDYLITAKSRLGRPGTVQLQSQFDLISSLALTSIAFAQPDSRLRLECQRDQPFANTLDLSGTSQGDLVSDPTLSVSPFGPGGAGRAREEPIKP